MLISQADLDAILEHCRTLLAVADELDSLRTTRDKVAVGALVQWRGDFAEAFRSRMDDEASDIADRARGLRADAEAWARIWVDSLNAENQRRRQRAVERERNRRGLSGQFIDLLQGDDSETPIRPYHLVPTPSSADGYRATGSLETF